MTSLMRTVEINGPAYPPRQTMLRSQNVFGRWHSVLDTWNIPHYCPAFVILYFILFYIRNAALFAIRYSKRIYSIFYNSLFFANPSFRHYSPDPLQMKVYIPNTTIKKSSTDAWSFARIFPSVEDPDVHNGHLILLNYVLSSSKPSASATEEWTGRRVKGKLGWLSHPARGDRMSRKRDSMWLLHRVFLSRCPLCLSYLDGDVITCSPLSIHNKRLTTCIFSRGMQSRSTHGNSTKRCHTSANCATKPIFSKCKTAQRHTDNNARRPATAYQNISTHIFAQDLYNHSCK